MNSLQKLISVYWISPSYSWWEASLQHFTRKELAFDHIVNRWSNVCDRGLNAIWVFLYVWWSYLLLDLLDKLPETEFDSLFVFSHYLLPWNTLLYIQSQTNTSDQTLFTIFLAAKREHTDDPIAKINPGNVSVNYWYVETFIYAATFLSLEAQFACALIWFRHKTHSATVRKPF